MCTGPLWGCSTVTNSVTDSTTLGLVAKVVELGTKKHKNAHENAGSVASSRHDVVHIILVGSRSRPDFGSGLFTS